ncbi:MAG: ubiquitin carboxyl-terminal hydrolase [Parachlamydiaceae bacterium]|nr:ubiquitin carboxyl-terminal hydrolase [Parachlamydiaceae bacterium]
MEPSKRLTSNTTIQDFPSVPTNRKATKADVSRAQLALNKIATILAKWENETIDEELFMQLACTWSRLDSELCSRKLLNLDKEKSFNIPNANLTSEKIQQIATEIDIFGKAVKALTLPENAGAKKVKDIETLKPRIPYSNDAIPSDKPVIHHANDPKDAEKPRIPFSNKAKASETPSKPVARLPLAKRTPPASTSFLTKRFDSVENGPIGLTNLGNSCYLNSSLQMLFSISDVRDLINKDGPNAKKDELLATLFDLLNIKNVNESANLTRKLRTILLKKGLDGLNGNGVSGQKDAHEVLNIILDELKFSPMKIGFRFKSNNDPSRTSLTDVQATYELSVELTDSKDITPFQDVINRYFEDEIMPLDTHVTMDDQEVFDLKKAPEILNLPSHLIISLNRFKAIGLGPKRNLQKIMTPIQFPVDKTVLLPFGNKKIQYEIIGYVNHHGQTLRSGHYTANVKNCQDPVGEQRWIQCNDSNVKVSAPKNESSDPYIILLKRKSI